MAPFMRMVVALLPMGSLGDVSTEGPDSRWVREGLCNGLTGACGTDTPRFVHSLLALQQDLAGELVFSQEDVSAYSFDVPGECHLERGLMPAIIVRPESSRDVSVAVRFAVRYNMSVSYRSGGHSYLCNWVKRGSLHLDLRTLNHTDRVQRNGDWYLRFGGGVSFGSLWGLIGSDQFEIMGGCSSVGVGWYLHGGIDFKTSPFYGLGNSTITNMTVVIASGDVVQLNDHSPHADLWAAMRQAGSSFGIATELTIRVFEKKRHAYPSIALVVSTKSDHHQLANLYMEWLTGGDERQMILQSNTVITIRKDTSMAAMMNDLRWLRGFGVSFDVFGTLRFMWRWRESFWGHLDASRHWRGRVVASTVLIHKSSKCLREALVLYLGQSTMGGECLAVDVFPLPSYVYLAYECIDFTHARRVLRLECKLATLCPDYEKYYNEPLEGVSPARYFPNIAQLTATKRRWDPTNVFDVYQGVAPEFDRAAEDRFQARCRDVL